MSNVLHALALHFIIASLTDTTNSLNVSESETDPERFGDLLKVAQ